MPEYWIADIDAERVERWRPGGARPEVLADRITWRPDGAREALEIGVAEFFAGLGG